MATTKRKRPTRAQWRKAFKDGAEPPKRRHSAAKALADPRYRPRVVRGKRRDVVADVRRQEVSHTRGPYWLMW